MEWMFFYYVALQQLAKINLSLPECQYSFVNDFNLISKLQVISICHKFINMLQIIITFIYLMFLFCELT